MFLLVHLSDCEFVGRRAARLLDEGVEQDHPRLPIDIKMTRAMRLWVRLVRTSKIPFLSGRQVGMPTGQPNSAVLMSAPIRFRSSS